MNNHVNPLSLSRILMEEGEALDAINKLNFGEEISSLDFDDLKETLEYFYLKLKKLKKKTGKKEKTLQDTYVGFYVLAVSYQKWFITKLSLMWMYQLESLFKKGFQEETSCLYMIKFEDIFDFDKIQENKSRRKKKGT